VIQPGPSEFLPVRRGGGRPVAQAAPRVHQAGFVMACCVSHEKWCWADRRNKGRVASPTKAQRRAPGRTSRRIERTEVVAQTWRRALYAGRLEDGRPSASVRTGTPNLLRRHGQRLKCTTTPARDAPDHAARRGSHLVSPGFAARRIHAGIAVPQSALANPSPSSGCSTSPTPVDNSKP
jgi:hypothetical protein